MKKGSLSLSINAIVILVLAIAMLGLGLAFTKTMFQKFGEKLSVPPPDIPATAQEPVVLPTEELEVKHNDEFVFAVNFYNDNNDGFIKPNLVCYGLLDGVIGTERSTGEDIDPSVRTITAPQFVEGGTYKSFKYIIPADATKAGAQGGGLNTPLTGMQDVCEVRFCPKDQQGPGCQAIGDGGWEEAKQIVVKIT